MPIPIVGGAGHLPKRVRGGRSYVLIDNTHSPVPLTQPMGPGAGVLLIPAGQKFEAAAMTCCHCQATVILNPRRSRPRNRCAKCNAYVCDSPGCNRECTPTQMCVDLALKHTGSGLDFLGRGKHGEVLFDPALRPAKPY